MFQIPKAATCYHGKGGKCIFVFTYALKQLESSEELIDQRNIVFLSVPKRGL